MQSHNFWLSREVFLSLAFGLLLVVPAFVFGSTKTVFVDKDANGAEDGTSAHPYHSISKALDHVKDGTEVFIAKGRYKENVTIPKGVKLIGEKKDRGDVIIESDNDDKPTIVMKHRSELNRLTVKGGRHGVRIAENSKAIIYNVVIKNSNRDGIHIDSAPRDKKYQAFIGKTEITNSQHAGIFSEKRNISVMENDIHDNRSDGIVFQANVRAWLEDNRINSNRGSGAKFVLDGASIFGKKNSFRNNKREGVEVNAYGANGTIELKRAAFIGNDRYGVARVARTAAGARLFGNLSFGIGTNASRFEGDSFGGLSPVVNVF